MSPSSRGTVTIKSADSHEPPVIKLNTFDHPADIAIAKTTTREILKLAETASIKKDIIDSFAVPSDDSDDAIEAFWRQNALVSWHASCTVKMGRADDASACLDSDFRVRGVKKLRVADMSAAPFIPNCHTQSVAYFIGETAAQKLIEEYGL